MAATATVVVVTRRSVVTPSPSPSPPTPSSSSASPTSTIPPHPTPPPSTASRPSSSSSSPPPPPLPPTTTTNFSLPRRTPSLLDTERARAKARQIRQRRLSASSAVVTPPILSTTASSSSSSSSSLQSITTAADSAMFVGGATVAPSYPLHPTIGDAREKSSPDASPYPRLTPPRSRTKSNSSRSASVGTSASPLHYETSPSSSSFRSMAWTTEEPSLVRRGSGRGTGAITASTIKSNTASAASAPTPTPVSPPTGHIMSSFTPHRVSTNGSHKTTSVAPPSGVTVTSSASTATPSGLTGAAPPPSPPRKSSKSLKLTPRQLAKRKAEEANRRDREADERAAAAAAMTTSAATGTALSSTSRPSVDGAESPASSHFATVKAARSAPLSGRPFPVADFQVSDPIRSSPLGRPLQLQHGQATSSEVNHPASNSATSTARTMPTASTTAMPRRPGASLRDGGTAIAPSRVRGKEAKKQQEDKDDDDEMIHYRLPTSASLRGTGAVGGPSKMRSVSEPPRNLLGLSNTTIAATPTTTIDWDEMIPPAIARKLAQEELLRRDPLLVNQEGLIDTWDRYGLPLTQAEIQVLAQQAVKREEGEEEEKGTVIRDVETEVDVRAKGQRDGQEDQWSEQSGKEKHPEEEQLRGTRGGNDADGDDDGVRHTMKEEQEQQDKMIVASAPPPTSTSSPAPLERRTQKSTPLSSSVQQQQQQQQQKEPLDWPSSSNPIQQDLIAVDSGNGVGHGQRKEMQGEKKEKEKENEAGCCAVCCVM